MYPILQEEAARGNQLRTQRERADPLDLAEIG
jgi:hypothetical protein